MIWQNYELDNRVLKANEALKLWQTEKGFAEIDKDTLAIPVMLGSKTRGYVFHGNGKLLLDAIVETEEGAFGKPVERELNEPFLMLRSTDEIEPHFDAASIEDLARKSYGSFKDFAFKAEDLFHRILARRACSLQRWSRSKGVILAIPNRIDRLDFLVAKETKVIYRALNMVFVSNENKVILKSPEQTVLSDNGKLCIVKC
jgi:hypothetical protein